MANVGERWAIDIDRDDIAQAALVAEPEAPLPPGAIEVAVDLFAMTANNVTYAALGKPMGLFGNDTGYWDFFADRDAPGRLPVWGFATVTRSDVAGVPVGERLYGYWPMASHALLYPAAVTPRGFVDGLERRRALPSLYNRYETVAALAGHTAADHDYWPVFRPLYLTGWLIADQLEEADDHGAEQVLVTAASSKTAMGFAHAFRQRTERPELIALTSAGSVDYLAAAGLYDRIVTYESVDTVPWAPTVLIDVAGNASVTRDIHAQFGDLLKLSLVVGKAHWDADGAGGSLPGPRQIGFFAPARLEKRGTDWGGAGLRDRIGAAWSGFINDVPALTRLEWRHGGEGALAAWREAVAGAADPRAGVLVARI